MTIERLKTSHEAYQFIADFFIATAKTKISSSGVFNVIVSGGSTPIPFFQILGTHKNSLDWSKVNFFWADERWVPEDHKENNFGEAKRAGLNLLEANYYPFNTSLSTPEASCEQLVMEMNKVLGKHKHADFILLGAGTDGHTVSIFQLNAGESHERAFVTRNPNTQQIRLSITMETITGTEKVLLLLIGEEKRHVLKSLLKREKPLTPIQLVIFTSLNPIIVTDIHD